VEMYNTTQNILNFDDLKVKDVKLTAENPQYINNNCLNNTIDDDNNTIIQKSGFVQQQIEKPAAQEDFAAQYGIVGSLFDTYILLQLKEDVLIIDQHAAHERLLYDKYIGQYYNRELAVQYLLAPYLLSVNAPEFEYIQNNIEALRQSGFNIEVFGERVFKLSALPALLSDMDIDKFFADILKDSESGKQPGGAEELIKERFIKKACRAAVKAGYVLSNDEIDKIVKQLLSGGSLHCPHGRPIVLRYNKKEIDKLFKRVL
jgi:DNA mismatch repair protein MutL